MQSRMMGWHGNEVFINFGLSHTLSGSTASTIYSFNFDET
uniref:Uncharacterized protein n=1 Tax=Moniliophthora roreri TaxID=221103 RepID=A0A0W0FYS5_MONRR